MKPIEEDFASPLSRSAMLALTSAAVILLAIEFASLVWAMFLPP